MPGSRTCLLILVAGLPLAATPAADPPRVDAFGDPLPQGPRVRLGTTRFRNVWSESPAALSPDARTLALMGGRDELVLMDAATGTVSRRVKLPDVRGGGRLAYLPGGKLVAVVSHDGLSVVDPETGRRVAGARFETAHFGFDPAVSADGARVSFPVLGRIPFRDEDRKEIAATVWDLTGNKAVATVRTVQNDLVRVSLSADGKVLATWGRYKPPGKGRRAAPDPEAQEWTVQVWDADTGAARCQVVLGSIGLHGTDPDDFVVTAAVSPDGKQLATAAVQAGGIELFDTATGKPVRRFASRGAPVKRLVYSPDGTRIAALGFDGAVQVWDLTRGIRLGVAESPVGEVTGVVFPDRDRVVAWALDGEAVALWDVPSGKRLHVPEGHTRAINSILFSADGRTVWTAGADHTIAVWDAATGALRSASRLRLPERVRPERRKAGSPPGWGVPDITVLSPSGKHVAVACNGITMHELLILDRATGAELLGLKTGYMPQLSRVPPVFTADGARLFYPAAGFAPRSPKDWSLPVWDIGSGRPLGGLPFPDWEGFPSAFSPDGARIVTLAAVRDREGKPQPLLLNTWDTATGAKLAELVISTNPDIGAIRGALAVASDNRTVVVTVAGLARPEPRLFTWDLTTGKVIKDFPGPDAVTASGPLAISPDGRTFAVGGPGVIRVCDLTTGEVRHELRGSAGRVAALAFSPDGKTLASGSSDTTVLLWDLTAK
jgi:WD40 repeat protein